MTASFPPRVLLDPFVSLDPSVRCFPLSNTWALLTLSLSCRSTRITAHLIPLSPSSTFYGASGVGEPLEKISLAMISRWIWDVPS